jgi:hypothetical protein
MIQPDQATDDKIIRCMRNSRWITKSTGTHSEYVIGILTFFPRQQSLRELASILRLLSKNYLCGPPKNYLYGPHEYLNKHPLVFFLDEAHGLLREVRNEYNAE